jgi:hypothetical protein
MGNKSSSTNSSDQGFRYADKDVESKEIDFLQKSENFEKTERQTERHNIESESNDYSDVTATGNAHVDKMRKGF